MSEIKHTPGPYQRVGTTVYALQHAGWRKGEEQFCNRIYAHVQAGPGCPPEEAEAVAMLFQAAPELLAALLDASYWLSGSNSPASLREKINAAISIATRSQS